MNPPSKSVPSHARSFSHQPISTDVFKRSLSPPPTKNASREQSRLGRSIEPLDGDAPDDTAPLKKSETTPSRKLSSNGFFKIARQASDSAFRSLNRKVSHSNLGPKKEEPSGVYEQNPRVYLYQHQQQDSPSHPSRAQSNSDDDNFEGDWAKNNQILQAGQHQQDEQSDSALKQLKLEKLRRNISLPDMNAEYTRDTSESTVPRAASPVNQLPGQATNRSNSRPRMQPHHFVTTAMSGEPITASDLDEDASSEQKGVSDKEQDHRPQTPQRSPSRLKRSHTLNQSQGDQLAVHNQSSGHLTKHKVLSEESLPGSTESRPPVGNKDLPPIPRGQAPAFQLCTRVRRKTEGGDSDTITSPVLLTSPVHLTPPVLPASSDTLRRKESSKGLLPQDVLKNMDPKDVQKAIKGTVVTSRVYKVMSPEQLDTLKKEQDDLEQFIETMNVTLHIESRMRDASHSLIRLHENNSNMDAVKAATAQLHATTRKMDQIVQKTQEAMWRVMAIQRLLLQHESAILNAGLRRLDNENRELSRTAMQLDTARDQEKEEKIKWKKEHNRLKFQSILFPATPILEEFQTNSSDQTSQKTQAQLESMEQYVKELNDEILHKEEQLTVAKNQLQAVKGWADDFQLSILNRKPSPPEGHQPNSNTDLEEQLRELQSTVESELKDMDIQVQEIKSKVDVLLEENSVLASKTKSDDDQRLNRRHRPSVRARTHARQGSDLQMVLRESLMELDRQIRQDGVQSASSSRPSSTSTSTSTTSISADSLTTLSRNTSNRSCGSPLSRSHSSSSNTVLSGDAVQQDVPQIEVEVQELAVSSSDEDTPAEDASEEIRRLSTMVLEMQQIVKTLSE